MAIPTPTPLDTVAVSAALPSICILIVLLRFSVRKAKKMTFKVEDWLIICALVLSIGLGALAITGVRLRVLAYPTPAIGDPQRPPIVRRSLMILWVAQLLSIPQLGAVKLSFLFWFHHIFSQSNTWFRRINITMMIIVGIWTLGFFLTLFFACKGNFSAWWSPARASATAGQCVANPLFSEPLCVSDLIIDIFIIAMPIPMIWGLHMPKSRKLLVTGVFVLGALAVISSIIRMVVFYDAKVAVRMPNPDNGLIRGQIVFWSMLECNLSLVAACLPMVYGLFRSASIQSIIRSVRSAISLSSIRSGNAGSQRLGDVGSTASEEHIVHGEGSTEVQISKNESETNGNGGFVLQSIVVNHDITQSHSKV